MYGDVHGGEHWDEEESDTVTAEVERFVVRFVDRVGTMAGISTEHLKSLYNLVPSKSHMTLLKRWLSGVLCIKTVDIQFIEE